jgi:hypothetical protein
VLNVRFGDEANGARVLAVLINCIASTRHSSGLGRAAALCPYTSDVDLLRDLDSVIDLDAQVAKGAFDLRVP